MFAATAWQSHVAAARYLFIDKIDYAHLLHAADVYHVLLPRRNTDNTFIPIFANVLELVLVTDCLFISYVYKTFVLW